MTRYLLDSGILGDFIGRRTDVLERARVETARGNRVGTATPVLGELVSGLERSATRDRNMQRLHVALPDLALWPYDEAVAFEFGRLEAELLRVGRPMQTIDIQLTAIARVLGNCVVVTVDGDLSAVPGLKVENWRTTVPALPPSG